MENTSVLVKAGESRGRAPGQASDYALRALNPLDSSALMTRCFIKTSGPPNKSGPQVFCPPLPPPSPTLVLVYGKTPILFRQFESLQSEIWNLETLALNVSAGAKLPCFCLGRGGGVVNLSCQILLFP